MPRIRSERPAFDAKYGSLVADLGRDLPQRATKPPQTLREELHNEPHAPVSPSVEGAHGPRAAAGYHPPAESGARSVEVPDPDQVRRPSFEGTDAPEETHPGAQQRSPEREQWRHPRGKGTPER
jgi:cytochrome c oxidase subunit 1